MLSRSFYNNEVDELSSSKINSTRERRAERRFNPLKDKKRDYSQTVCPTQLCNEFNQTRKPNKITSTKPDLDLLFSLFSVIEENYESEYEGTSPHTSPIQIASTFPIIPSQENFSFNNVNAFHNYQVYPNNIQYNQGGSFQNVAFQPIQEFTYAYTTPTISPSTTAENLSSLSYSCDPSSFSNEEDDFYSASFEQENVNSYHDIMTLLPPIFLDSKINPERAVPFSELVDVFNM